MKTKQHAIGQMVAEIPQTHVMKQETNTRPGHIKESIYIYKTHISLCLVLRKTRSNADMIQNSYRVVIISFSVFAESWDDPFDMVLMNESVFTVESW